MVTLKSSNPYLAKDQAKSNLANKFIGKGCKGSSTEAYRISWDTLANCGEYTNTDVVFISVNGSRAHAVPPLYIEIYQAVKAGATLVTDKPSDRNRIYSSGERGVADFLLRNGYEELSPGMWQATPF